MNNIHINNSYNIWQTKRMKEKIVAESTRAYHSSSADVVLNRSFSSMYVEWWLHNIGYYITKPMHFIDAARNINLRCKDVDLDEWKE